MAFEQLEKDVIMITVALNVLVAGIEMFIWLAHGKKREKGVSKKFLLLALTGFFLSYVYMELVLDFSDTMTNSGVFEKIRNNVWVYSFHYTLSIICCAVSLGLAGNILTSKK